MSDVDVPLDVGDFRLVDRRALDAFRSMRETNRYVRGMFSWIGYRQVGVPFRREERYAGETKYPLRKMLKFATDGIVSFSAYPLRLALKVGFVMAGAVLPARHRASSSRRSPASTMCPVLPRSRSSWRSSAGSSSC